MILIVLYHYNILLLCVIVNRLKIGFLYSKFGSGKVNHSVDHRGVSGEDPGFLERGFVGMRGGGETLC